MWLIGLKIIEIGKMKMDSVLFHFVGTSLEIEVIPLMLDESMYVYGCWFFMGFVDHGGGCVFVGLV